ESRSRVHRISDDRELPLPMRTHSPGERAPRVHRDTEAEHRPPALLPAPVEPPDGALHLEGAQHRVPRVIRIMTGGAEDAEDPVSDEVLHMTLMTEDYIDHRRQVFVEHLRHRAGRYSLAECREASQIGHQYGHLADFIRRRLRATDGSNRQYEIPDALDVAIS